MTQMFVVVYTHRLGVDVKVATTRAYAVEAACAFIVDWWEEIDVTRESAQRTLSALRRGDYEEALNAWNEYQTEWGDEHIEIVLGDVRNKPYTTLADAIKALT